MTATSFHDAGFVVVPDVLSAAACATLIDQLAPDAAQSRTLLAQPWCARLARQLQAHPALAGVLAADAVAVQCTYFEKSRTQNWLVALHQDLSIPVRARVAHAELAGWSHKQGQWFVQPPPSLLADLVAVRLHLDPCMLEDGPLQAVPGSHRHGRLAPRQQHALAEAGRTPCLVDAGGVLLMRPLLLHASSKASGTSRRRVLHFLFGPPNLPAGLAWPAHTND